MFCKLYFRLWIFIALNEFSSYGETRTEEIPALGVAEKPEQNGEEKEPATMNVGAVVGGAVGGTAGVGIIVVIILVIIKKKKVMWFIEFVNFWLLLKLN